MNLFELYAKIALDTDDYENGLEEASGKTSSFAEKLKSGLATAAKVGTAALTAAATGIAALTKQAVSNYSDYEQLVGGVETLFAESEQKTMNTAKTMTDELFGVYEEAVTGSKTAIETVMENAAAAYQTAGLSANEYMETVTAMAAALKQSTETELEAAEKADQAIIDMADNANKMGSSMESIQNAYNGFAKQNYTMLDNLKLGYGGTKEEMERLLEDATAISGIEYDISSYADIVDAIHVIQTELGITGTTALEASTTIQGSVSSMKAAWRNFLTGLGDSESDIGELAGNVLESALTVVDNVVPVVGTVLSKMGRTIAVYAPSIISTLISTVTEQLPSLVSAAISMVEAVGSGLVENLPLIASAAIEILFMLVDTLTGNVDALIDGALAIIDTLVDTLTSVDFLTKMIDAALELILALAEGLIEAIPELISQVPIIIANVVAALITELPSIITAGIELIFALIDGIIQSIPELAAAIPSVIIGIVNGLLNNLDKIILAAPQIILALIEGLIGTIPELIMAIPELIMAIVETFTSYDWGSIGKNIVEGLKQGIADMWESLKSWVSDKFSGLVSGVKSLLGINSPSKVFAGIGGFMAEGLGEGWDDEFDAVKKNIEDGMDFGAATVDVQSSVTGGGLNALSQKLTESLSVIGEGATIVVQSVLDGKVIGETSYQYSKSKARACGA